MPTINFIALDMHNSPKNFYKLGVVFYSEKYVSKKYFTLINQYEGKANV